VGQLCGPLSHQQFEKLVIKQEFMLCLVEKPKFPPAPPSFHKPLIIQGFFLFCCGK